MAADSASPEPSRAAAGIGLLEAVRNLHSAGGALLVQALLHGQLARVEWEEEKHRLLQLLLASLFGFACLLCLLLFAGGVVLVVCWETAYRIPAALCLILLYGFGVAAAWRRIQACSVLGERAFAASLEEFSADAALLKSHL